MNLIRTTRELFSERVYVSGGGLKALPLDKIRAIRSEILLAALFSNPSSISRPAFIIQHVKHWIDKWRTSAIRGSSSTPHPLLLLLLSPPPLFSSSHFSSRDISVMFKSESLDWTPPDSVHLGWVLIRGGSILCFPLSFYCTLKMNGLRVVFSFFFFFFFFTRAIRAESALRDQTGLLAWWPLWDTTCLFLSHESQRLPPPPPPPPPPPQALQLPPQMFVNTKMAHRCENYDLLLPAPSCLRGVGARR